MRPPRFHEPAAAAVPPPQTATNRGREREVWRVQTRELWQWDVIEPLRDRIQTSLSDPASAVPPPNAMPHRSREREVWHAQTREVWHVQTRELWQREVVEFLRDSIHTLLPSYRSLVRVLLPANHSG